MSASEPNVFEHGEYFVDQLDTPQGVLQLVAEVQIFGQHLVLDELLVYPLHGPHMEIGVKNALRIRRHLERLAEMHGYNELTVISHRVGKPRPGPVRVATRRLK